MSNSLKIGSYFDDTPNAYKNFYYAVIEPELLVKQQVRANDYLREYKAQWNFNNLELEFETESDLTFFLLRWS